MGPKNQIHFSVFVCQNWMKNGQVMTMGSLYTRYPIVARALGLAAASKGILHTNGKRAHQSGIWLDIRCIPLITEYFPPSADARE